MNIGPVPSPKKDDRRGELPKVQITSRKMKSHPLKLRHPYDLQETLAIFGEEYK